jgi:predicted phosphodiesterase
MTDPAFQRELTQRIQSLPREEQRALRPNPRSEAGSEEIPNQESVTLGVFRSARELRSAKRLRAQEGVTAVIFGHTHQEIDGNEKDAEVPGYFNTGTWTPRFDLRKPENRALLATGRLPLEVLGNRHYFELRLMYADITVDGDSSKVELKEMAWL